MVVKTIILFLVLSISVGYFGITWNAGECLAASATGYTIPRHLEYSLTLQNTTNHVIKEAELLTYAPILLTVT
jgi:hypothetical protein